MPGPRVLVVAGHDPSPGVRAGVDADREACAAMGAEAVCVVTARTDQGGGRVLSLGAREPSAWLEEARVAAAAAPISALKLGLLPGADHVRAAATLVGELCARAPDLPVVCDPVLAASGGETFLDDAGIETLLVQLLPQGPILTPNLPEAAHLTGRDPVALSTGPDALPTRLAAAQDLLTRGASAVLLKAGHGPEDPLQELLLTPDAPPLWLTRPRRPGPGLHGSGCRHASALAALLAQDHPLPHAATTAGTWLATLLD